MNRSVTKRAARVCVALLAAGAIVLSASARACMTEEEPMPWEAMTTTTVPNAGGGAESYQVVAFETDDGLTLSGRLYGSATKAVILSHMYPADQTSWNPVAEELSRRGYLVLTFDFRGYGDSEGSKDDLGRIDQDVAAAFKHVASAGATDVVLVGASMGGTASLTAAATFQALSSIRMAGVVTLSAPVEFMGLSAAAAVPNLVVPLLFIAAEGDEGAEGARQLQELSGNTGDLQIVLGSAHGSELFTGAQAEEVWTMLLSFLEENMPAAVQ